jgi:hypothetical protein
MAVFALGGADLSVFAGDIAAVVGAAVASEVESAGPFTSEGGVRGNAASVFIASPVGCATAAGAPVAMGAVSDAGSRSTAPSLAGTSTLRGMMTGEAASAAPCLDTDPERRCLRVMR